MGDVIRGPWRDSNRLRFVPPRLRRKAIPNRYIDQYGGRQLMDCVKCRTPFAPDVEVPKDRKCAQCRGTYDQENPTLPLEEE